MDGGRRKKSGEDELSARLHAWLDGELSPEEALELESLLAADPTARQRLQSLRRLATLSMKARTAAPAGFADRVMDAVNEPVASPEAWWRRADSVVPAAEPWWRRLFPPAPMRHPGFAGALAVIVVALLVATLTGRVQRPEAPGLPAVQSADLVTHRFELVAPDARKVCLVGDFNQWHVCEVPMVRDAASGTWSAQIQLPRGRHQYMFVLDDGRWVTDPGADVRVDDGFGNKNAVVFL